VTVVSPVGGGWTIDRTLTWSYNANGGPAQAAVYVQIDTHPTFTAVDTWQSQWFSLSSSGCTIPAGVDLVGGTTYYWRVLANNGQTNSDWSASGSFRWATVPTATPVSPVNGARATSRVLTWAYNANGGPGQGGFILQISTHSDFGAIDIVDTGFTSSPYSSWTMPDGVWLANGTTFYWRVTVENDETGTPWSSTASFVWGG
jgi:hypothetical protein